MSIATDWIINTSNPVLSRAVIDQLGEPELLGEIARHGADAGWPGFTYYSDTCAFFDKNASEILSLAQGLADQVGEDMLAMVAGFACLRSHNLSPDDVFFALRGENDESTAVKNALAWFALEEVAREIADV